MPLAGTAGVDFVVLVATSLTFETAGFSILSVNPVLALLLLMKVPDVSLELGTETGVRDALFGSVVTLLAIGVALLTAARVAAGVVFFAGVPLVAGFAAGFAAGFILLFTGFFAGLAIDFVADVTVFEAGFSVFAIVFANLPATVFNSDFLAGAVVALLFDAVVFVIPLMLLAAALLVADLVTVAFMVSSDNEPPRPVRPLPENRPICCFQEGSDRIGRRVRHLSTHIAKRLPPLLEPKSNNSLYQTLFQAANKSLFREIFADEHHFATARLIFRPFRANIRTHYLMYSLE